MRGSDIIALDRPTVFCKHGAIPTTLIAKVHVTDVLMQRGPTTGPRSNFAQVLSITSSGNFFFGERSDFGTKIGISEIDSS